MADSVLAHIASQITRKEHLTIRALAFVGSAWAVLFRAAGGRT